MPRTITGRVGQWRVEIRWLQSRAWLHAGFAFAQLAGPVLAPMLTGGVDVELDGKRAKVPLLSFVAMVLARQGDQLKGADMMTGVLTAILERLPVVTPDQVVELAVEVLAGQCTLHPIAGGDPVEIRTGDDIDRVLTQPWDLFGLFGMALRQFDPTSPGGPIGQGSPGGATSATAPASSSPSAPT